MTGTRYEELADLRAHHQLLIWMRQQFEQQITTLGVYAPSHLRHEMEGTKTSRAEIDRRLEQPPRGPGGQLPHHWRAMQQESFGQQDSIHIRADAQPETQSIPIL